jgi:predicted alpha/beta hydrolase family esterase
MRTFLLLHGWHGPSVEHWQTWLSRRLRQRGERVLYPSLPEPDEPRLGRWLAALDDALQEAEGETHVLCHSLACVLWFHHAARAPGPVARVLLVAPPGALRDPAVATFFPVPYDARAVRAAARETRLVCSDGDPTCPAGADRAYPGLEATVVPGGAHLDTDAGYGPWPWAERWALEGVPDEPAGGPARDE